MWGTDEAAALDVWVAGVLAPAVAYARSLLRDRSASEDVVHDCLCRLLKRADVYDLPRDGTKLLYRAITNACINIGQRSRTVHSLDAGERDDRIADRVMDRKVASPTEMVEAAELSEAIESAMQGLSMMQRAALELKSLGHSLEDIADTLGLTANNAGVLIHRARHAMKQSLASYLNVK